MEHDHEHDPKFIELLQFLKTLVDAGEAEVHFVPVHFTHGTCMNCSEPDQPLLPVGPDGKLFCADCGEKFSTQTEAYFEKLMKSHLKSHAAEWN